MAWTDERIDTLKKLWEKGLTASQIAETLGEGVSRNAVIGKAHRLGLKSRPSPVKGESGGGQPRKKPSAPRKPASVSAKKPDAPKPSAAAKAKRDADVMPMPNPAAFRPASAVRQRAPGEKVTLLDLNERICKWPIGHPDEKDFHFCGDPVNPGFPYCMAHCAEAYQAQLPRDRNRPSRPPMPNLPRPR